MRRIADVEGMTHSKPGLETLLQYNIFAKQQKIVVSVYIIIDEGAKETPTVRVRSVCVCVCCGV